MYQGRSGGLYPGGANVPPPEYLEAGQVAASKVQPINGKIVVLSQGYSNVRQEFAAFESLASTDPARSPAIVLVNGAQPGKDALEWQEPANDAWATADAALATAGVGRADVQVIWFKTTRIGEKWEFPTDAERLLKWTRTWVANMEATYPNLKLIYAGSRIYGGYSVVPLNPEPWAYQSSFAVKWLIEERIAGTVTGPAWVGWGPYLWADGANPRHDGLSWACTDFDADGVHPGPGAEQKVASRLLAFFKSDPTSHGWFAQ